MTKNLLLVFILLFVSLKSLYSDEWEIQSFGQIGSLWDVHFIDNNKGWAVGCTGTIEGAPSTILFTSDGGENWEKQNPGTNVMLFSVFFNSENNGWAVGKEGTILNTTNCGQKWNYQNYDNDIWFRSVYFINENKGWIVGYYHENKTPVLLYSSNKGENWNLTPINFQNLDLQQILFVDESNGWMAGGYSNLILHSTNGGNNWELQNINGVKPILSIFFTDSLSGWAVGGSYNRLTGCSNIILQTNDGGRNWYIQSEGNNYQLFDVHFVDNNNGWAVGGFPSLSCGLYTSVILHTTDGGINWKEEGAVTESLLEGLFFVNKDYGWTVGVTNHGYESILHKKLDEPIFVQDENLEYSKNNNSLCYPNPFSKTTTIKYETEKPGLIKISYYDNLGNILKYINKFQDAGNHAEVFNADNYATGIYFYKIQIGKKIESGKLFIIN
ncbi:MAG: T9SS type A sorting domain-containing protein [Bacteroidetes bacterium]|nr:MAG: T9SS type A sorting domain-containing protein [Bacteroidota bacterium]